MSQDQDQRISEVVQREASRLRRFIRRRVADPRDAEDILQDVFYELVEANRLLMPIDHVTGWLFRVARNRITDLFRRKAPEQFGNAPVGGDDDGRWLEELLPSPDAGPDALYARTVLLDAIETALDELPEAATRGLPGPRGRRAELQGDRRRHRHQREYAAVAEALRRAPSARAAAPSLR